MSLKIYFFAALAVCAAPLISLAADPLSLRFEGKDGPGRGRHVVLISGDEEYRSEETLPMLAKILSQRHGFTCTMLFSIDPATGTINPNLQTNVPGLEALQNADLMIIATRFRQLDQPSLRYIADFLRAGKPVIGLRTATHAFTGEAETDGIKWKDFGPLVLGEKWVNHHGRHKVQGTRVVIEPAQASHAVLNGVREIFGASDVYTIANLEKTATILLRGQVTASLAPDSAAIPGPKNDPMMPVAWLRDYTVPGGKAGRAFCTTMGASVDFLSEDLRRLVINAAFHLTGLPVPPKADVAFVDPYEPSFYGLMPDRTLWEKRAVRPSAFALGQPTNAFAGFPFPAAPAPAPASVPAAR